MTYTASAHAYKCVLFFVTVFVCYAVAVSGHIMVAPDSKQSDVGSPERSGNVSVALTETFFQNAIPLVLPVANTFLSNLTLPSETEGGLYIDKIHINSIHVSNASLTMESPNQIFLYAFNVGASIPPTKFIVTAGIVKCDGTFEVFMNSTDAMLPVTITRLPNGTLTLKAGVLTIKWGRLDIHHTLDGFACTLIESIISVLIGNLNNVITSLAEKELPKKIARVIDEQANEFLATLPIVFTRDPNITTQRMKFDMDIVPVSKPLYGPFPYPLTETQLPNRDAAASISVYSINNFLKYLSINGTLNRTELFPAEYNSSLVKPIYPDAYKLCPDCQFVLTFGTTSSPPVIEFGTEQSVILHIRNLFLDLQLIPPGGKSPVALVEILLNVTGGVNHIGITLDNNFTFKANSLETFSMTLLASNIGPLNTTILNKEVLALANGVLIPLFNSEFKGLKIPLYLNRPLINVTPRGVSGGVNVKYEG